MERLTRRDNGGNARMDCDKCEIKYRYSCCSKVICANQVIARLADFEEFGLEPADFNNILEEYAEIKKAEADERLLILPCRLGETIFVIWPEDEDLQIREYTVLGGNIDRLGVYMNVQYLHGGAILNFRMDEFGKRVFLNRRDAEIALKQALQSEDDEMTRPSGLLEED